MAVFDYNGSEYWIDQEMFKHQKQWQEEQEMLIFGHSYDSIVELRRRISVMKRQAEFEDYTKEAEKC